MKRFLSLLLIALLSTSCALAEIVAEGPAWKLSPSEVCDEAAAVDDATFETPIGALRVLTVAEEGASLALTFAEDGLLSWQRTYENIGYDELLSALEALYGPAGDETATVFSDLSCLWEEGAPIAARSAVWQSDDNTLYLAYEDAVNGQVCCFCVDYTQFWILCIRAMP